ncbi:MAG TPA: HEAT repeat domain-containing protein [Candidatus Limnocylindrales bacterium]
MLRRIGSLLAIRPGEGRCVALVALFFGFVEAGRGFGEIGADTLFLSRFGAAYLPDLYIALGLISLIVAIAYGTAIGRLPLGRLFVALLGGFAAVLVILRLTIVMGGDALPALWLTVYVIGAILGTLVWTLAGAVFDARQAKRLFPLSTSAAIAGSFLGTLAAGPVARLAGAENLVLVDAGLLAVAAALAGEIGRRFMRPTARRTRTPLSAELRAGFDYVRHSPLMRFVALAYVLFAVLLFAVSFPFLRAMSTAFHSEADLATALGLLSAGVTATSFVISLAVANRIYSRFGVATAALVLPLVYVAGFSAWLVQFSVVTAVAFRFAQQVTQRSLSNAAWSAFYNVVPAERRGQVLAFNDGVPGQLGIALSGVLLIAAGTFLAPSQVFWIGLVTAAACTWVVLQIRRRYAESLMTTLRAGLAEQILEGGPGLAALTRDPQVIDQLRVSLLDANPGVRRLAAEMLGRLGARNEVRAVIGLFHDPDPGVRRAALGAVAVLGTPVGGDNGGRTDDRLAGSVADALDDPEPEVRVAAVSTLFTLDGRRLAESADRLAHDASPAVRAELSVALVRSDEEDRPHAILAALLESDAPADRLAGLDAVARLRGHAPSPQMAALLADRSPVVRAAAVKAVAAVDEGVGDPMPALAAALTDDSPTVRFAAARGLNERFDAARELILDALRDGPGRAQEAALVALDGHGDEVRGVLLEWAAAQVVRAERLREHAAALDLAVERGQPADPTGDDLDGRSSSAEFLGVLLTRREWQIEERLLRAVALLGAPEASGLIRRCLRSNDPETRAQAIEALDSLGDRDLGRAIVRLLESDPRTVAASGHDVLREVADDPDPWVRALALRTLAGWLDAEREAISDQARTDIDPIVRSAVGPQATGGSAMPTTREMISDMERMLFLRRVPLFSSLSPEDLQRVAMTAVERFYPGNEAIVREGELGDELVVIVEGSVRVVHGDDAEQRVLRTYEAGDHFGELAVLRERPRAATVIADAAGVRGLVIDGEGLRAILRERPEAAMAMLATLAERLITQ